MRLLRFLKKEEKQQEQKFVPKSYVLFNVDTFNTWFNDKDNGAEYAHSGIFLRLDKLSENHLIDYFKKCHNIDNIFDFYSHDNVYFFMEGIKNDWRNKINVIITKEEKKNIENKANTNKSKRFGNA